MNSIDYMYLDEKGHQIMAEVVFEKVKEILK